MATLYDLLPEEARARFPWEDLQPRAQRFLSQPLPDRWKPATLSALTQATERVLPRMTVARADIVSGRTRAAEREAGTTTVAYREDPTTGAIAPMSAASEADIQRQAERLSRFRTAPTGARVGMQFAQGLAENLAPFQREPTPTAIPAPEGAGEWAARVGGALVPQVGAAGVATKAAMLARAPVWLAAAMGGTASSQMQAGTPTQRLRRGLAAGATSAVIPPAARRLVEEPAERAIQTVGSEAARRLISGGERAASATVSGTVGGPVVSLSEWALGSAGLRDPGEETRPTLSGLAQDFGVEAAVDFALGGRARVNIPEGAPLGAVPPQIAAARAGMPEAVSFDRGPAPQPRPTPRPVAVVPEAHAKAIAHELREFGNRPNPVALGASDREVAMRRVEAHLPQKPVEQITRAEWVAAAKQARADAIGYVKLNRELIPPGARPNARQANGINQQLAGQTVTFDLGGQPVEAGVVRAFVFDGIEQPVRVLAADTRTGELHVLKFGSPAAMVSALTMPERPVAPEAVTEGAPTDVTATRAPRAAEVAAPRLRESIARLESQIRARPQDARVRQWRARVERMRAQLPAAERVASAVVSPGPREPGTPATREESGAPSPPSQQSAAREAYHRAVVSGATAAEATRQARRAAARTPKPPKPTAPVPAAAPAATTTTPSTAPKPKPARKAAAAPSESAPTPAPSETEVSAAAPAKKRLVIEGMPASDEKKAEALRASIEQRYPGADATVVRRRKLFYIEANEDALRRFDADVERGTKIVRAAAVEPEPTPAEKPNVSARGTGFVEAFSRLWKSNDLRDVSAAEVRAAAEAESGEKAPPGFDAEAERSRLRRAALAEAGQGDMFGGLGAAAATKVEAPRPEPARGAATEERPELAAAAREVGVEKPSEPIKVRSQSVHVFPKFQVRETGTAEQVEPGKIQAMLEQHGGYAADLITREPILVWRDVNGEVSSDAKGRLYVVDGHHRLYVAQHQWAKQGDQWVRTGQADRDIAAVEVFGTRAQMEDMAELVNLTTTPPTYAERAKLARKFVERGEAAKLVAAKVQAKSAAAVERMRDFAHLDADVQRAYFPAESQERMTPFGELLGKAVREFPSHFVADNQRAALNLVTHGDIPSVGEFSDYLGQKLSILRAYKQEGLFDEAGATTALPSDRELFDTVARILRFVRQQKEPYAAETRKMSAEMLKTGKVPADLQAHVDALKLGYDRAVALESRFGKDAITKRITAGLKAGESPSATLAKIRAEVEKEMGPWTPADAVPAGAKTGPFAGDERGFINPEILSPALWLEVLRGTPAARARFRRSVGRGLDVKTVDGNGNILSRERVLYEPDPYSESAFYRFMAQLGLAGGNVVLPPDHLADWKAGQSEESFHYGYETFKYVTRIGEEAARLMAPYMKHSVAVSRVMAGKSLASTLDVRVRGVPEALRRSYREMFEAINAMRVALDLEPLKPLTNYDGPHIIRGRFADSLVPLLREIMGDSTRAEELTAITNRFLEERVGNPEYLEDATLQFEAYVSSFSRYASWLPVLKRLRDTLRIMRVEEPMRAGMILNWLKATRFREKGSFEKTMDSAMKHALFAQSSAEIQDSSPAMAATRFGVDVESLVKDGWTRFYDVAGDGPVSPKTAKLVSTLPNGDRLYATKGGALIATGPVRLRSPIEWWQRVKARGAIMVRSAARGVTGRSEFLTPEFSNDEHMAALGSAWREQVLRFENDPFQASMQALGVRQLKAVLGWNRRAFTQNIFNNSLTDMPEYHLSVLQAYSRTIGRPLGHMAVDALRRLGFMTAERAAAWKRARPRGTGRDLAESTASLQGEVERARQRMLDVAEGRAYMEFVRGLQPLGIYRIGEDLTRGVNAIAADIYARRMGLDEGVKMRFAETQAEHYRRWGETIEAIRTEGTIERFVAMQSSRNMFDYNELGQAPLLGGPVGKWLARLTTFPREYAMRYLARPLHGAGSVATGAARAALGLGAPQAGRAPRSSRVIKRGKYPAASTELGAWLESGGARSYHREAAKVFLWQLVITGALHGITEATGVNALIVGSPGWEVIPLLLMSALFPHDELWKRALERAKRSAVITPSRGPANIAGLAFNLLSESYFGAQAAFAKAERMAKDGEPAGAVATALIGGLARPGTEFARQLTMPGLSVMRRGVQANPETYDRIQDLGFPIYEILGVRSVYPDMTPAERELFMHGLLPVTREQELRRPAVQERRRRRTLRPSGPRRAPAGPARAAA